MPLRSYQQDAVSELRAAISRFGSACLRAAQPAAGKTVVAGEIARLAAGQGFPDVVSGPPAGAGQAGGGYADGPMPRHQHRRGMPWLAGDALGTVAGFDGAERGAAGNGWASLTWW